MSDYAFCQVCIDDGRTREQARFPVEEIWLHLRVEHDIDGEIATWPDGEVVIVDNTLEPGDFATGGSAASEEGVA